MKQEVEVAALEELLEGGVDHDGFHESEEELYMIDFDNFGEDDLDGSFVLDEFVSVFGDEGDEELYVGAHEGLVVLDPVLRHEEGLIYFDVLLIGGLFEL